MEPWQIVTSVADGVGTGVFVMFMALGKIVPRSTVLDYRHQFVERLQAQEKAHEVALKQSHDERDYWRALANRLDEQLDALTPAISATHHLVESMPTAQQVAGT